jgi:hypothetical protein
VWPSLGVRTRQIHQSMQDCLDSTSGKDPHNVSVSGGSCQKAVKDLHVIVLSSCL